MTKQEFDRIVKESVDNGNTREAAEAYVRAGFKIDDDAAPAKKAPAKRPARKQKR